MHGRQWRSVAAAKQPFILGVYTDTTSTFTAPTTGFNMDYTQVKRTPAAAADVVMFQLGC